MRVTYKYERYAQVSLVRDAFLLARPRWRVISRDTFAQKSKKRTGEYLTVKSGLSISS